MREYRPNKWVLVHINESFYRVIGGWSGGYLDGDHWRASSAVCEIRDKGDEIHFLNQSGSVYKCRKDGYGTNVLTSGVINDAKKASKKAGSTFEVINLEDIKFGKIKLPDELKDKV